MSEVSDRVTVIRVQDRFGRGPYRPGFTNRWRDYENSFDCPPWWEELGMDVVTAHGKIPHGGHIGCAFRSREQLDRWFTLREQVTLDRLGYRLAAIVADRVLFETPRQLVVQTARPLAVVERSCRIASQAGRVLLIEREAA